MKRLRHLIEYAGCRIALSLLNRLSLQASERLAIAVADAWYFLNAGRRRIAIENIRNSGISDNDDVIKDIARKSFQHFAVLLVESFQSGRIFSKENWQEKIQLEIDPGIMAMLKDQSRGMIMVSGHIGNWEIAAPLISFLKPVTAIARNMNNPYTNRLFNRIKPKNRFSLTPKHDAGAGRLLSVLKRGEILALLIDQHAREQGISINFFGRPASTHTSPALLHLVTDAPLCFGYCIRKGPMSYHLTLCPPITYKRTGNKDSDVRTILETLTAELENVIRKNPEQYLWGHRRWKR